MKNTHVTQAIGTGNIQHIAIKNLCQIAFECPQEGEQRHRRTGRFDCRTRINT